jgi:hypothetical protein
MAAALSQSCVQLGLSRHCNHCFHCDFVIFICEGFMHHLTTTLIDLHQRLEEAGDLLEKLSKEFVDLSKENTELRQKLFFTETEDDGRC